MNTKQLQQTWIDWNKTDMYSCIRFGQYVFNEYNYEVGDSYNIEDATQVYNILFESLTNSLDELV